MLIFADACTVPAFPSRLKYKSDTKVPQVNAKLSSTLCYRGVPNYAKVGTLHAIPVLASFTAVDVTQ